MPRMHFPRRRTLSICIAMLSAIYTCVAQESRATITGTVTDPQGAAIPGASVVAKHLATNLETRTTTNEAGTSTCFTMSPPLPTMPRSCSLDR